MAMNWKILGGGMGITLALVAVLASGFGKNPQGESNALEGKPAAAFTLESMEAETVSLASLRGTVVVINFWATWCQPCQVEHADLLATARAYEGRGVRFFGLLYNDEATKAAQYLQRKGSAYPTLLDPAQRTAIAYGVTGVPETFVIDKEGMIRRKFSGPVDSATLSAALEPLL
jgi:cytochrome c biogenesis protein CcmG, thiol:disulfide interchange protein DsbE